MSERLALAGRIRAALEEVKISVNRTVMLAEKASRSGDDDYWDGVALNLHGFYSGVEQILRISRAPLMEACLPVRSSTPVCCVK